MCLKNSTTWILSVLLHCLLLLSLVISSRGKSHENMIISIHLIPNKVEEISKLQKKKEEIVERKVEEIIKSKKSLLDEEKASLESKKDDLEEKSESKKTVQDLSNVKNIYEIGSIKNPAPTYPRIARLRKYQGEVEIAVIADFNGNVIDANIYKSSGFSILDDAALDTLKNWRFSMNKIKNKALSKNKNYRIIVPIRFVLE